MPNIIDNPDRKGTPISFANAKFEYDYPKNLDLKPGSKLHDSLVSLILNKARESKSNMQKRYGSWKKIDHSLTAYIPSDVKEDRESVNKTTPVVVPLTFATLDTLLTYIVGSLLQDPILKYQGFGPEDVVGASLLEQVIQMQAVKGKLSLALHTHFRDALAYGLSASNITWEVRKATVRRKKEGVFSGILNKVTSGVEKRRDTIFEGNVLGNIDPYSFLPDPNVSIDKVQKGEYVGWLSRENLYDMLSLEAEDSDWFNVKYVKELGNCTSTLYGNTESGKEAISTQIKTVHSTPVDNIYMYVNLIPKDHKLGSSNKPEKWLFCLSADKVITRAQPLGLDHEMYPVITASPDFDGHSSTPLSRLEVVYGLQDAVDWLFSSHVANVKKAINDTLIVDPFLVNMNDVLNPRPGRVIRLRKAAWGRGTSGSIEQLKMNDVTRSHIADTGIISEIMKQTTGATDVVQGIVQNRGERVSATEARGGRVSALSRLERMARVMAQQSLYDAGYMFASHTQQLMKKNVYVRLTGELEAALKQEYGRSTIEISPYDISVDYDIMVNDGSLPNGEFADSWINLYQILATQPQIAQQFDMVRIFTHIAKLMGVKSVNEFVNRGGSIQPQVMQDENVQREVEKGNLIPVNGQ